MREVLRPISRTVSRNRNQLRVGRILSRSLWIWIRNFVPFTLLGAIVFSPYVAYTLLAHVGRHGFLHEQILWRVGWILSYLFGGVATGVVAYGVFRHLRGTPARIGASLGVGLRRFSAVLGVALLTALITGLGFLLLVVPGVVFSCMLAVAVPVAIIEKPGVLASLNRSLVLTRGNKDKILGVFFLTESIGAGLGILVTLALRESAAWSGDDWTFAAFAVATALLAGPLHAVASVVIYHDLRVDLEGVTIQELASVFD